MRLTVAICTWNRARLLDQTLARMRDLRAPAGCSWELLVVNNNCTDATDAVLERHSGVLPLRRLSEPTPGKSRAANLAVREAAGEYVVWTDDDVLVEPDWLERYAAAFRAHPGASVFGGPVEPWFEGEPPAWLEAGFEAVAGAFAAVDHGPDERPMTRHTLPFGANMAFRTAVLRERPFDPDLGVVAGRRLAGEETALLERLLADGHAGWWLPGVRVRHHIPPARQTVRFVRRFYHGYGETLARQGPPPGGARVFGRPRWLLRRAIEQEARYRWRRAVRPAAEWVAALRDASITWGRLAAAREPFGGPPCA